MITVTEIAAKARVHTATASRALNGKGDVAPATRARILKIASDMGYHPEKLCRIGGLRDSTVGIALHPLNNPTATGQFYYAVLDAIQEELAGYGSDMVVLDVKSDESIEGIVRRCNDGVMRGVIVVGWVADPVLERLALERIPMVVVNHSVPNSKIDFVTIDNINGARKSVHHLIGLGHRRIAFVTGGFEGSTSLADRLAGYRLALMENGMGPDSEIVLKVPTLEMRHGQTAARQVLECPQRPTAIVVAADQIAIGMMGVLSRSGIRIPEDLSVIGFDDIEWAAYSDPPLTTVRCDRKKIAELTAHRLLSRLNSERAISAWCVVDTELVIRDSTAPCPNG